MNVVIVHRERSDADRAVREYLREFERRTAKKIEIIDPDTRAGVDYCQLYDIVEYPSVVATDESGSMLQLWRGLPLPTINEISYYVQ